MRCHDGSKQGQQQRRRPRSKTRGAASLPFLVASIILAVGQLLPLATCNTAATIERRGGNLRHRGRILQSYTTNTCKQGRSSLVPGDSLVRGEFLCHGSLRFGIDAIHGQFILGFAENSNSNSTLDIVTPTTIAWTAIPTKLFTEKSHPFHSLTLTDDGNLFGFDEYGEEIYDSNYDYYDRLESKEDDSILCLSPNCATVASMEAMSNSNSNNGGGAMCVTLTSPQMPGVPHGMVTWGVMVHVDNFVAMEPPPPPSNSDPTLIAEQITGPIPTWAPVESSSSDDKSITTPQPTLRPTSRVSTRRPTPAPTGLFDDTTPTVSVSYESTSIIWGTVWLDSNQNKVKDLEVRLFECDPQSGGGMVDTTKTVEEGMYFFQVPTGRMYRVQFDLTTSEYVYTTSQDTDADGEGWTSCESSRNDCPIQWNAGLYSADGANNGNGGSQGMPDTGELPENLNTSAQLQSEQAVEPMASIGGFIYLVESNGRAADVVPDAMIVVSLTDCTTGQVLGSLDVAFPGTYSFDNLTEGYYKLGYEMVVLARSSGNPNPMPLYSFINADEESSTSFETECGKLGKSELIDSGNVGLRMAPLNLDDISRDPESGGAFGPLQGSLGETETTSSPQDADKGGTNRIAAAEGSGGGNEEGGKASFVPALVGVIATLSVLAAGSIVFVKHRGGGMGGTFPFLGSKRHDGEDVHSVGSSVEGDTSLVSATPSANQNTAIGSLIVETGTCVDALTAGMGEDDESDSDSNSDSGDSSDEEGEESSYTGMEFALKGSDGDVDGGGVNSDGGEGHSNGGGGPYQGSFSPTSDSHSHIEQIQEEGSEGYEVYDDEDDEENGHGSNDADYGPVVSNIIAKYSQKQTGQNEDELPMTTEGNQEAQDNQSQNYSQHQDPHHSNDHYHAPSAYTNQDPSQNYSQQQGGQQQENSQDYHASAYQYQNQTQYQDHQAHYQDQDQQHPNQAQYQDHQRDNMSAQELAIVPSNQDDYHQGGYYSNNINNSAYDNATPLQYNQYSTNDYGGEQQQYHEQQQHQQQYDEATSITSGSSRSSADPPAASYRDIPASNNAAAVGWDTGVQAPNAGWDTSGVPQQQPKAGWDTTGVPQQPKAGWDTTGVVPQQPTAGWDTTGVPQPTDDHHNQSFETPDQYAVNGAYAENYDSSQYTMANNDGAYESNQYAANNNEGSAYAEGGAYATTNYDNGHPQNYDEHQSVHSAGSDSDSSSDSSDSSSEDEEEASASGWSSSSSTANSSAVSRSSNHSNMSFSTSAAAAKSLAARKRAQSNPRDDRQSSWRHPHAGAIPENSTVEYNAYAMANNEDHDERGYNNGEGGGFDYSAPMPNPNPPPAPPQVVADDNKSVQSAGSDQSADPPGASYKNLHAFPPPPPRRRTPPRRTLSPKTTRRGRSVPPPPPRGSHPSPPPPR